MNSLSGKVAFITGGAGGFGLALARRFASLGTSIMLADIEPNTLDAAVRCLREVGADIEGLVCDVTERESMNKAAAQTKDRFGHVHYLCNNAGVVTSGRIEKLSANDWEWVFAVNVMGVVNGISAFLPQMLSHNEPSHIINTASIAGLKGMPSSSVYCASKAAVIALSESLRSELADSNIGVTVLCPSFMKTKLFSSGEKRTSRFGGPGSIWDKADEDVQNYLTQKLEAGLDPDTVAELAIRAISENHAVVTSNEDDRAMIADYFNLVLSSFDRI